MPTERLLYPVTKDEKLLTVDTSKKYPVAAVPALQLVLKETSVTLVAAETVGDAGAVVTVPLIALLDVPLVLLARTRT